MTTLETRTIEQLPEATTVSPNAVTVIQEPGAPAQKLRIDRLVGRLIATQTLKLTQAALYADLAHVENTVALVYADPESAKSGWYRKTGASGAGNWVQFETLSIAAQLAAAASASAALQAKQDAQAVLDDPDFQALAALAPGIAALAAQAANIAILAPFAPNLAGLADTQAQLPQAGYDGLRRVELDPTGRLLRSMDRNGRVIDANPPAVPGVDTPGQRLAYIDAGNINVIGAPTAMTIPGAANYSGGPTLAPQQCGIVDGRSVLTINRPFERLQSAVWLAQTAGMLPLYDPDVCYIILGDGQSLIDGTLGRWHSPTQFRSTPTLPENIWMPATRRASDVRCGRYKDWNTALNTVVAADDITGLTRAGPRSFPVNSDPSNAPFNETPLERFSKRFSDEFHAGCGRRPMVLIASLGLGAVSIDNMQKTGAANIPNNTTTKYAQDILILTRLRDILVSMGKRGVVVSVLRKHGETSAADVLYASKATAHINDLNADIRTIFGQAGNPIWIENVTASYGSGNNFNSALAIGAMHDSGILHIAGPDYPLLGRQGYSVTGVTTPPNWDWVHLSARGSAIVGEDMFDQFWQVFAFNRRRKIVRPLSAVATGNVIRVVWDSPSGQIEAATEGQAGWTDPGNWGLNYRDIGASPPVINSVALVAPNITDITMNASLAGRPNPVIDYANNYSGTSGFTATNKPRGMLRDPVSPGVSEVDGAARHYYATPWRIPVTGV